MEHERYMKLAIGMAEQTAGQTSPNPKVGAVVVRNGEIVGLGAHLKAGEGHAEVHALNMAGNKAEGATMYVTLEPCSHYGKTPPCADLVIERGIHRVYIATLDPNPLVAGRGVERLKDAGIDVHVGLLEKEAISLNRFFNHFMKTNLPFVTLKAASSLDGKTAANSGDSKWITGEDARLDVHQYRHEHDAILVGVNTIIQDDPQLTTRLPSGGRNPIRIILDTNLRIPEDAKVLHDGAAETIIIAGSSAPTERIESLRRDHVRIIQLDCPSIEIYPLLERLVEEGVTSIFVEGGSSVHASFMKERCFQEMITYIAPKLIGGKKSPSVIGGEGIETMAEAVQLEIVSVNQLGDDLKIISVLKEG
ncbi:bifunctional diaminohydroxyphosphoribosylaminopyrimidine deaminase/5-amino-6-(5-phosphoribosylamino)uracil reductase RibD [Pseudalkalibacillus sp. SCS-8]|uniref:bifunctional diaminohydroxyphosphoribosylaminopyrimidine deaminase/5-amino-6-(5-phosphoribosylamino)uracil reductase RibD n=1 Tax=Pseudalkalibacillus nanhaiensis TaxID=3115291 RepID=UPI0032DAD761